ncbi:DNA-binding protein [Neisseria zalophi]|uniref:DNA-binding protein n=1 Tax=Neisseria zalophi TaxID=640030 RepID=A0A5J6Q2F2_9NEIS|nr:DNA-binding protein [Neisseria zalophi]
MNTFDVNEAAEYCKCHPETIRQHIRQGRLVASKPGRKYCIKQSALDAFLVSQENCQLQASLISRSEKKCQYTKERTESITLTLPHKAAKELDNRLAPKTRKKPKNSTIK